MRNSSLLKWAHAQTGGGAGGKGSANANTPNSAGANGNANAKEGSRSWIHSPDALQRGHIAYLVKFLGRTDVAQAKGIGVVKEAIRKLKFTQQLRKAEGSKTPKVELTVSIDGVAIQEPKSKRILHQYPLHRISYCADDKGDKRFFSFIAKEADSDQHACFVFVSDKLAEEITLTIGQAFDLAYRRFVETSGRDLEAQRRLMLLQQRTLRLEAEAHTLRQRLRDIAKLAPQADVEQYMQREGIRDLLEVDLPPSGNNGAVSTGTNSTQQSSASEPSTSPNSSATSGVSYDLLGSSTPNSSLNHSEGTNLLNLNASISPNMMSPGNGVQGPPPVPPRAFEADSRSIAFNPPSVGTRLEGLLLDELDTDDDFDPRAFESAPSPPLTNGSASQPVAGPANGPTNGPANANNHYETAAPRLAPPPKMARDSRRLHPHNGTSIAVPAADNPFQEDLFGSTPFNPAPSSGTSGGLKMVATAQSAAPVDPFGMGDFSGGRESQYLESAIGLLDKRILEMKDGFSRGLSFGNEDFSLESLDPLRN